MSARTEDTPPAEPNASPTHEELGSVLRRNIAALHTLRAQYERSARWPERHAQFVGRFFGSPWSVAVHFFLFGTWLVWNSGVIPGLRPFDPFPFVMLAMWASVEAIFLTTFVLISQNRAAVLDERRQELNLQVSLLAEHEITQLLRMVERIGRRVGEPFVEPELDEMKRDVSPESVFAAIEEAQRH